jgi:hypothetical protein
MQLQIHLRYKNKTIVNILCNSHKPELVRRGGLEAATSFIAVYVRTFGGFSTYPLMCYHAFYVVSKHLQRILEQESVLELK